MRKSERRRSAAVNSSSTCNEAARTSLLCSVCAQPFNEPVVTPCGHTFCRTCLAQVAWNVAHESAAELRRVALMQRRRVPSASASSACGAATAALSAAVASQMQPRGDVGCPLCRASILPRAATPPPSSSQGKAVVARADQRLTTEILIEWPTDARTVLRVAVHFAPHVLKDRAEELRRLAEDLRAAVECGRPLGAEVPLDQAMVSRGGYMHRLQPSIVVRAPPAQKPSHAAALEFADDDDDDDMAWCRMVPSVAEIMGRSKSSRPRKRQDTSATSVAEVAVQPPRSRPLPVVPATSSAGRIEAMPNLTSKPTPLPLPPKPAAAAALPSLGASKRDDPRNNAPSSSWTANWWRSS